MITLQQARQRIGAGVVYRSQAMRRGEDKRPAEDGIITSVGREVVFVAYGRNMNSAATSPDDLDFLARGPES